MNINNCRVPFQVKLGTVQFGTVVRVHKVPEYWTSTMKSRNGRYGKYFLLTSEYYRDQEFSSKTYRHQLLIDLSTGIGVGVLPTHEVEIIHNAEVALNENC